MRNISKFILLLILINPFQLFASGGDVISLMLIDFFTFLILTISIFFLKWKIEAKLILFLILILSEVFNFFIFGFLQYSENIYLINSMSIIIPLFSFLISIYFLKKGGVKSK